MTRVTLQYFHGCPHWETAEESLAALVDEGWDVTVEHQVIESQEEAEEHGFTGSPTVLVGGRDPFATGNWSTGLACRTYQTEAGRAGSPSIDQLRRALSRHYE